MCGKFGGGAFTLNPFTTKGSGFGCLETDQDVTDLPVAILHSLNISALSVTGVVQVGAGQVERRKGRPKTRTKSPDAEIMVPLSESPARL